MALDYFPLLLEHLLGMDKTRERRKALIALLDETYRRPRKTPVDQVVRTLSEKIGRPINQQVYRNDVALVSFAYRYFTGERAAQEIFAKRPRVGVYAQASEIVSWMITHKNIRTWEDVVAQMQQLENPSPPPPLDTAPTPQPKDAHDPTAAPDQTDVLATVLARLGERTLHPETAFVIVEKTILSELLVALTLMHRRIVTLEGSAPVTEVSPVSENLQTQAQPPHNEDTALPDISNQKDAPAPPPADLRVARPPSEDAIDPRKERNDSPPVATASRREGISPLASALIPNIKRGFPSRLWWGASWVGCNVHENFRTDFNTAPPELADLIIKELARLNDERRDDFAQRLSADVRENYKGLPSNTFAIDLCECRLLIIPSERQILFRHFIPPKQRRR